MKYKNRLIVPTAVAMSLIMSHPSAHADEIEGQQDEHHKLQDEGILNEPETEVDETSLEIENIDESNIGQGSDAVDEPVDGLEMESQVLKDSEKSSETQKEEATEPKIKDLQEDLSESESENLHNKKALDEVDSESSIPQDLISEDNINQEDLSQFDEKPTDLEPASVFLESEEVEGQNESYESHDIEENSQDTDLDDFKDTYEQSTSFEDEPIVTIDSESTVVSAEGIDKEDSTQIYKTSESMSNEERMSISKLEEPEKVELLTVMFSHEQSESTPIFSDAQYATRIIGRNNSGLYSPITSNRSVPADRFLDTTLFIDRQGDYNGSTYYRILNGLDGPMQGWMKAQDLNLFQHTDPSTHKHQYYVSSDSDKGYLLDEPWGTTKQQVKQLNQYSEPVFNAEKSMKLGALTFYYGKIGNDYGWIQDRYLQDLTIPVYSDVQYSTKIKSRNNSGLYSPITSNRSVSADRFLDTTLFIDRQGDYNGSTYYRILNGLDGPMQGWMKAQDLNLFQHTDPSTHKHQYYVSSDSDKGYLLDEPWGTTKQQVKQLNQYSEPVFNAEKSMKLGALTFYYGKIGNDYGWIQDRYLTIDKPAAPSRPEINTVRYNQSLNQVLDIQMNLSAKPQAWVSGGGWRDATRSEVRNFLDTSHQQGGAWDYTFLNLDQSQGISASVLNSQLLSNRGILTNQGSAFAQAAETHGVNEVYLISHAVLETGHGTSQLAQGVRLDRNGNLSNNGTKYYNMYGVGAVDNNALLGGARYAQRMGWDTPEKAIIGGAAFVSQNYFNRGQNTLYAMRWNPHNPGTYQYATDVNWAYATARNLESYYRTLGVTGRYFTRYVF